MGGEAVLEMLRDIDVHAMAEQLRLDLKEATSEAKRKKLAKRLKVVEAFRSVADGPSGMLRDASGSEQPRGSSRLRSPED